LLALPGSAWRENKHQPVSLLGYPAVIDRGRNQLMGPPARALVTLVKFVVSIGILVLLLRGQDLSTLKADLLAVKLDMLAVLPAGGDAVRIWMLRRRGEQWFPTISSVVADHVVALLALCAIMFAGMPFLLQRVSNSSMLFAIVAVLAFACFGTIALATLDRWPPRIVAVVPSKILQFAMLVRAPLLTRKGGNVDRVRHRHPSDHDCGLSCPRDRTGRAALRA
jgi:glycosyltransferase 2 family protein